VSLPWRGAGLLLVAPDRDGRDRVLLGLRTIPRFRGTWTLPGGGWEPDTDGSGEDRWVRTAVREASEEVNGFRDLLSSYPGASVDRETVWHGWLPGYGFTAVLCRFPVMPADLAAKEKNELDPVAWFLPDALPGKLHPYVKTIVRFFRSRGKIAGSG
jgi:8-oxo-dGTP pyrophosphatase MutT (NUDIX family)